MCGSVSAVGLADAEREAWPFLRERLRQPGRLMGLMRGVLGDTEVGVVVAATPEGVVTVLAILSAPPAIAEEIRLTDFDDADGFRVAFIGDYEVRVVTGSDGGPLAILTTPWIEQHLLLYARTLWRRRYGRP